MSQPVSPEQLQEYGDTFTVPRFESAPVTSSTPVVYGDGAAADYAAAPPVVEAAHTDESLACAQLVHLGEMIEMQRDLEAAAEDPRQLAA